MSRKSIILCVSVLGVFLIVVAAALYFLYSGTGETKNSLADSREYMLFSAIPSDADAVLKYDDLSALLNSLVSDRSAMHYFVTERNEPGKMAAFLTELYSSSSLYHELMSSSAVLSVHNIGEPASLLVLDAGKAGDAPSAAADLLVSNATGMGMSAEYADISEYAPAGSPLRKRSLLLISSSDILIQSALRHIKAEVSVLDKPGFPESADMVSAGNMMVIPESGAGRLVSRLLSPSCRTLAESISGFADCAAFEIRNSGTDGFSLSGQAFSDGSQGDMLNIYRELVPSKAGISGILPSYTISAVSVPFDDVSSYQKTYLAFAQTKSLVKDIEAGRAALKKATGTDPESWAEALALKEVATAQFTVGGNLEKILLARSGRKFPQLLFKGIQDVSEDDFEDKILPYGYKGYLSSLFGDMFSLEDESSFIMHGGWLIIGSRNALSEYISGRALDYVLSDYLADAAVEDRLSARDSYLVSYMSLTEDAGYTESLCSKDLFPGVRSSFEGVTYEPVFFTVSDTKSGLSLDLDLFRTTVLKSQAPAFERDTDVLIPEGPFRVKNSGTGKWNLFYQQDNFYLCLQEEGGKGLWGVPFDAPICGCAQTVDYFANGKLQILFASGTKLHLIDRLGRFVNPFPVDLKKPVLLGPDVYDFSGNRKYNVMILHTDNTIEMYNLQGRRPAEWKTITSAETIKGLPERIRINGSTYWVVRTSIQTLIFGFYGGEPLTAFTGDRMIRPDSEVVPVDGGAVEVVCYDGKKHTVKISDK